MRSVIDCPGTVGRRGQQSGLGLAPVHTVLVTTDYSPRANLAIPYAYQLAGEGGTVVICHVADAGSAGLAADVRRDLQEMLRVLVPAEAVGRGMRTETVVQEGSDPAEAIAQVARRLDADLVVMASHGRSGLRRALLGSVAESVMRSTSRPVVIVPVP
jgi:nucleotide-binding universal stress UspA family protein